MSSPPKDPLFPSTYCEPIESEKPVGVVLRMRVMTAFLPTPEQAAAGTYLTLAVGDKVDVTSRTDGQGWWRGRLAKKFPVFPSSYAVELPSEPPTTRGALRRMRCVTAYTPTPEQRTEGTHLTLSVGDLIDVTARTAGTGWWRGVIVEETEHAPAASREPTSVPQLPDATANVDVAPSSSLTLSATPPPPLPPRSSTPPPTTAASSAVNFCMNCGAQAAAQRFCSRCGHKLARSPRPNDDAFSHFSQRRDIAPFVAADPGDRMSRAARVEKAASWTPNGASPPSLYAMVGDELLPLPDRKVDDNDSADNAVQSIIDSESSNIDGVISLTRTPPSADILSPRRFKQARSYLRSPRSNVGTGITTEMTMPSGGTASDDPYDTSVKGPMPDGCGYELVTWRLKKPWSASQTILFRTLLFIIAVLIFIVNFVQYIMLVSETYSTTEDQFDEEIVQCHSTFAYGPELNKCVAEVYADRTASVYITNPAFGVPLVGVQAVAFVVVLISYVHHVRAIRRRRRTRGCCCYCLGGCDVFFSLVSIAICATYLHFVGEWEGEAAGDTNDIPGAEGVSGYDGYKQWIYFNLAEAILDILDVPVAAFFVSQLDFPCL